jgi:hypothetical protein
MAGRGGGDGDAGRRTRGARSSDSSSLSALLLVALVFSGGVYLLLIDTTSLPELYTGAVITLLAVIAVAAARSQGFAEASIAPRWLLRAWRPFARIPLDVAILSFTALAQLVRPAGRRGRFVAIPFAPAAHGEGGNTGGGSESGSQRGDGRAHEPVRARNVGQRALAEALGCVSPNTIVLGIDTSRRLIVAHQLRPHATAAAIDPMDLG